MRRTIAIATATIMALMFAVTTDVAAQQFDTKDRTFLTFSSAVELPGIRLEPGTYVFKLADTSQRNVVQVMTEDEKQMLGQWFFAPAQRQEVTSENVVTFRETSAGATPAIRYWYFPGEKTGKELMYPKDQAMRIAQRTGATVLTEDGPVAAQARASAEAQIAPAQEQGAVAAPPEQDVAASAGAVEGSGLPETPAQPVATDGRNDQAAAADQYGAAGGGVQQQSTMARNEAVAQDEELPRTGSPLALGGLIALLSLAGAAGLRALRR